MTMFDRDTFDESLEAYLDGDLPAKDAQRLEAFAAADEKAGRELRFARRVQERMRALPQPACPPDVTRAVLSAARADARRSFVERLRTAAASSWTTILRPSLAMGVFVGLLIGGSLINRSPYQPPVPIVASEEATPQEVARALNEAKWALAYLSNIGRRTATTIRDDVLNEHVVRPVNRALDMAFEDDSNIR